jgi:hypothetical protein
MRRPWIAFTMVALAAALPVAAYATTTITRHGDKAVSRHANGCQVIKNADHSVSVRCPVGVWTTLRWSFLGHGAATATVDCLAHPCRYTPTVVNTGNSGLASFDGYVVSERVHHNRIVSMTATLN